MDAASQVLKRKRHASKKSGKQTVKLHKQRKLSTVPDVAFPIDSPAGRMCMVLELGSASVWDYLPASDAQKLLMMFPGAFSDEFVNTMTLKAIQTFAVENKTHLGRQCGCDWMRRLDFIPRSADECTDHTSYILDQTMPIFQVPGGARALLSALLLTKKLLAPIDRRRGGASTFVPLIFPLVTKSMKLCPCTKQDVTRVMNSICNDAGSRYFREFKRKRGKAILDYLDHHWDGIEGATCQYCDNLTRPERNFMRYSLQKFEQLRSNCSAVYRPLKSGMLNDLQFVRFVPRRRGLRPGRSLLTHRYYGPYEGLAAGITEGGILCGFYLVDGFKPHY
jgi:hypothetical protein